eukprot:CAMPEP_0197642980 /NCGR_PEP_ID=MMETSP1338-20131121/16468_1 /TAXON_ID=43686 ORGANISM="Pelagodinium beii, Strain RCC1491" /NCGR_SAMPLE_ID=MMETSP1338 /ASSEMBLY_ACC=CAM_ASM_000754 /LENGTH=80 /DNA_ID=CAMNT_0043216179 /DNA_START=271 /DNA_END=509 /DNA_ORIENTATION=+
MADLQTAYGKSVDFVQINADEKLTQEQNYWARQFQVSEIPNVAFLSAGGDVKTELAGRFSRDVLRADVKALSEGKDLPYT